MEMVAEQNHFFMKTELTNLVFSHIMKRFEIVGQATNNN
ncbi:MAG: hypothetical protein OJF59_000647 [Cytophagales bacterium]|nr:MAG: hypothetical protein OJF59_000647 [Cytophagales bacterium]